MARIGPAIPLNDLTLYLDASINTSYPGYGSIWYDLSGKANNFTLANTPTYADQQLNFNGITQYAECVNTTAGNMGTGSYTIEILANISASADQYEMIAYKRQGVLFSQGNPGWKLQNNYEFAYGGPTGGGSGTMSSTFSPALTNNTTYHIIHSVTRANGGFDNTINSYVNGDLKRTVVSTNFTPSNLNQDNSLPIRLMRQINNSPTPYTSGSIYFFRIWNRALTPSEVGTNWDIVRNKYGL